MKTSYYEHEVMPASWDNAPDVWYVTVQTALSEGPFGLWVRAPSESKAREIAEARLEDDGEGGIVLDVEETFPE